MRIIGKAAFAATTVVFCLVSAAAPARAESCWQREEVAAAKVRELQTMLMVAALRCRAAGMNILPSYNAFVSAKRQTISTMNARLKDHFGSGGPAEGQRRYDRFTTSLANAYGAGTTDERFCGDMEELSEDAADTGSTAELIAIAERNVERQRLAGGACPVTLANK